MQREERLREQCRLAGQEHVFAFWGELSPEGRSALLNDLEQVRFEELPALLEVVRREAAPVRFGRIEPPVCEVRPADWPRDPLTRRGEALLRNSAVAALTVAGGQGTRLGFEGPKGLFPITPVRHKSLFQVFAEQVVATDRRHGGRTRWYIMTSEANDAATREYFEQQRYFGLDAGRVVFFVQGSMPAFSRSGRLLLEQPGRLALSPDGHGGSLLAMARRGVLEDMRRHGVEHISYFQVDNPLVRCLDPYFIGLHDARASEMSCKMVPKAHDHEKVGVFAVCDGLLRVLEYSDLPDELATARNADGTRRFDAGSIAVHLFARRFVERLTADPQRFRLPWHRAEKKVAHVDPATRQRIEPSEPNAVKLEAFVFDALPLAERAVLLQTERAEEFSPVKNPSGADSVETARRDLSRRAARWLEAAGAVVGRTATGEPDGVFEVSPLRAMCAEDLASGTLPRGELRGAVYVE